MPKRSRKRRRQQPGARRRADQGELREIDLDRARRRPGADDEVELEVLHRGIEDFLDRRIEAMDLVDEQDVVRLEIGELRGEIARLGDHRPRGRAEIDAELARDDLRQRRLAEARRADEQHVIERLAARLRRFDEHLEVLARRLLAGEVGEHLRAQRGFVLGALLGGDETAGRGGHFVRPPAGGAGTSPPRVVRPSRLAAIAQTRPAIAPQATSARCSVASSPPENAASIQSPAEGLTLHADRRLEGRAERGEPEKQAVGHRAADERRGERARRAVRAPPRPTAHRRSRSRPPVRRRGHRQNERDRAPGRGRDRADMTDRMRRERRLQRAGERERTDAPPIAGPSPANSSVKPTVGRKKRHWDDGLMTNHAP